MTIYRFDRIEVRPEARQLLVDGQPAALGARAFDVLVALLERRDRVVGKNELLDLVWSGSFVEENNLQVQVSALRRVLGSGAIATIPGRGYRFTLDDGSASTSAAGRSAAEPPASLRSRGNAPLILEPAIGREGDIAALRSAIAQHRLVSIIGAGGIGKTKVALALADALRDEFRDGVWFVELATLVDGSLVGETVARTVGVQLAPGRPPDEALAAAIGDLHALVVLDNCEHLAAAVTTLVDAILSHVPALRIVVTSQESLRTPYEHVYRLEPLATPARDAALTPALAANFASVRLLVERASAADRRFALTASNVDAIADICRRLDGIPLALELAAARMRLTGPEALRQRLDERFRVLTAGARSELRRHQTLRGTLEWSHGLLSPDEQVVFRRLGVFAGGSSLAMVQAVATDDQYDAWAVLSALGMLVDKSLVVADGGDAPRYRLLETTRGYALEQLAAAGETKAWMRRHAEAVLDMLKSHGRARWHIERDREVAGELDNVRAAIDWALDADGDHVLALALVAHSSQVWWTTVTGAEGLVRASAAARHVGEGIPPSIECRFWLTYATLGVFSSRGDCFDAAQRAAECARALDDAESLYQALIARAGIGARRHEFAAAHQALLEARQIENQEWAPRRRSLLAFAEWVVALREGRYADARRHAQRQAELNRAAGNALGELLALGNVAASDVYAGEPEAGARQLRHVIAELDRIGEGASAGHAASNLAMALLALGEIDEALAEARRAYRLLRREGDQSLLLPTLARLAAARGDAETALMVAGYTVHFWQTSAIRPRVTLAAAELAPDIESHRRDALMAAGARLTEERAIGLGLASDGAPAV